MYALIMPYMVFHALTCLPFCLMKSYIDNYVNNSSGKSLFCHSVGYCSNKPCSFVWILFFEVFLGLDCVMSLDGAFHLHSLCVIVRSGYIWRFLSSFHDWHPVGD